MKDRTSGHPKPLLPDLKDLGPEGLRSLCASWGEKHFRASQIGMWLYREDVVRVDEMTNIPKALRERLGQAFSVGRASIEEVVTSRDGSAKFLLRFPSGRTVETVHMPLPRRTTVCLSSQTGCPMGCAFCATGASGPGHTLTAGEIVEQVLVLVRRTPEGAGLARPTHVVFMGMGEPLLEPDAVITASRILVWEHGFGYARRRITVSTCGIPSGIRALMESGLGVNLALSLNAPWEGLRASLMPKAPPLEAVLPAVRAYREATRATLTLEYVLLAGVNDSLSCAKGLGALATSLGAKVNLIVFNEFPRASFRAPPPHRVEAFREALLPLVPVVTVRESKGSDVGAGCGQLAGRRGAEG